MRELDRREMARPTFIERLATRRRLWWEPPEWGEGRTLGDALHRRREIRALRARTDPDELWHCCDRWQRSVLNKWNGREFVAKHGCPVPELYWYGGPLARLPFDSLPEDFVVRPVRGSGRRGVLVVSGGRELVLQTAVTRADLRRRLSRSRRLAHPTPILIESLVGPEDGERRLPLECKCHAFAGTVVAVELVERTGGETLSTNRYYTPAWEPFPDTMNVTLADSELRDPPECLDEILRHAATLGAALGTYMRIDFFATGRRCMFNEFSSLPDGGGNYTPYCDELFGAAWAEEIPDAT